MSTGNLTIWSYDILSLNTASPISHGEVQITNLQWSQRINSAGALTGKIAVEDARVQGFNPVTQTTPNKTVLIVDLDGVPVWAGLVRSRHYDSDTKTMDVTFAECFDYFKSRNQAADYANGYAPGYPGTVWFDDYLAGWSTAAGADPRIIAGAVMSDALDANRSLNSAWQSILLKFSSTGTSGTYQGSVAPTVGAIVQQGNGGCIITGSGTTAKIATASGGTFTITGGTCTHTGTAYTGCAVIEYPYSTQNMTSGFNVGQTQPPSPPLFAPVYPISARMTLDHIVTNLSDAGYKAGFDFAMMCTWSNGTGSTPVFAFYINYPRRGTKTTAEVPSIAYTNGSTSATYTGFTPVVGTYVTPGTNSDFSTQITITAVNTVNNTVTLSLAPSASGTGTAEFDPSNTVQPRFVNDWLLDLSGEGVEYVWDEDGTEQANYVVGSSSSTGVGPVGAQDGNPINAGWPLTEAVTAFVNAADTATLQQDLNGELARREWPIVTATVTVPYNYPLCPYGPYGVPQSGTSVGAVNADGTVSGVAGIGDHVIVQSMPDGRFPNGLNTVMRIVGVDVTWPDDGLPTVAWLLNMPLTGLPSPQPPGLV